jgi:hypothetical protein
MVEQQYFSSSSSNQRSQADSMAGVLVRRLTGTVDVVIRLQGAAL